MKYEDEAAQLMGAALAIVNGPRHCEENFVVSSLHKLKLAHALGEMSKAVAADGIAAILMLYGSET